MDAPNDIDVMLVRERLDGISEILQAALHSARHATLDAMCSYLTTFEPDVARISLTTDHEGYWCFRNIVDADGQPCLISSITYEALCSLFRTLMEYFPDLLSDPGSTAHIDTRARALHAEDGLTFSLDNN